MSRYIAKTRITYNKKILNLMKQNNNNILNLKIIMEIYY